MIHKLSSKCPISHALKSILKSFANFYLKKILVYFLELLLKHRCTPYFLSLFLISHKILYYVEFHFVQFTNINFFRSHRIQPSNMVSKRPRLNHYSTCIMRKTTIWLVNSLVLQFTPFCPSNHSKFA